MAFMFLLSFLAAAIAIVTGFILFVGAGMVVIGITGIAMNKIYVKHTKTDKFISNPLFNKSAIVLGLLFLIYPAVSIVYGIIYSLCSVK